MVDPEAAPRTALHHTLPQGRFHLNQNSHYSGQILPIRIKLIELHELHHRANNRLKDFQFRHMLIRWICSDNHQDSAADIFYYQTDSDLPKLGPS